MLVVNTLAPLILLIALGAVLAHIRFLGQQFMADLNKLAFWIALPALLFISGAEASEPGRQTWMLLALMLGGTVLISLIGWAVAVVIRVPVSSQGSFVQSAFRGNLAYIGVPVLAYSFSHAPLAVDEHAMATAVIVMVVTMAFYNVLAVIVLQASQHSLRHIGWSRLGKSIGTNPLLLSGFAGLVFSFLHIPIPRFVATTLHSLGNSSVPIALMCIGGALATTHLQGRRSFIALAAILKVAVLPVLVYFCTVLLGLSPMEQRIALVLSSCPTAAASFVMAREMGGDTALASGSIALSTLFSAIPLVVSLWLTA